MAEDESLNLWKMIASMALIQKSQAEKLKVLCKYIRFESPREEITLP